MLLALLLAATPAPVPAMSVEAQSFRLDNGLTVIISPDHKVPGVVVDILYDVGSRDEEKGRTGFAHLFEHLMFMGARYVPYPGFDTLMEQYGGRNNASTSNDITRYYETGPSNLLEMFLWMESDRMATLSREMTAEKLQAQRLIVLNERRQSYENRPYGMGELAIYENLFPQGHAYSWPVIGSSQDLEAAQLEDVINFFNKWYAPSNAILSIVGDVDPRVAAALVRKYFDFLPKQPKPLHPSYPPVKLEAEKRVRLTDQVELPKVTLSWPTPPLTKEGDADFDVLSQVLANGKASRLYQKLVHEQQLASEVSAYQESMSLQSVFHIEVTGTPGSTPEQLVKAADAVVAQLKAEGPTQAEVDSARLLITTGTARNLESLLGRADLLNAMQRLYGDPTALDKDLARYAKVTPQTARAAAVQYLTSGRVVIEVVPAAAAGEGN